MIALSKRTRLLASTALVPLYRGFPGTVRPPRADEYPEPAVNEAAWTAAA